MKRPTVLQRFPEVTWAGAVVAIAFLAMIFAVSSGAKPAGAARCHLTNYRPFSDVSVTYKARGNRCEGLYSSPVSSSSLRLLGYHDGRPAPQPFRGSAAVQVKGLPSAPSNLLLRGLTTRALTNYAMDTTSVRQDGRYIWDTSVLSASLVAMRASEMTFTACSNLCVDGPGTVYYPVAVTDPPASSTSGYRAVVQSQRELKSIAYALEDAQGNVVRRDRLVRSVPARRPVDLPIPTMAPGIYTLKIDAVGSAGSQALLTVRIVQP